MRSISKKLIQVIKDAGYVQKDAVNDFHKYKYATAEKVFSKVRESLARHGVALVGCDADLVRISEDMGNAIVKVTLHLADPDTGETISVSGLGQGSDRGDKAVMKAVTAACKYALSTGLLISWGDDPEADTSVDWDRFEADMTARIHQAETLEKLQAIGAELSTQFKASSPPRSVRNNLQALFRRTKSDLTATGSGQHAAVAS